MKALPPSFIVENCGLPEIIKWFSATKARPGDPALSVRSVGSGDWSTSDFTGSGVELKGRPIGSWTVAGITVRGAETIIRRSVAQADGTVVRQEVPCFNFVA